MDQAELIVDINQITLQGNNSEFNFPHDTDWQNCDINLAAGEYDVLNADEGDSEIDGSDTPGISNEINLQPTHIVPQQTAACGTFPVQGTRAAKYVALCKDGMPTREALNRVWQLKCQSQSS